MYTNTRMSRGNYAKGSLTGTTAVIMMDEAPFPCTVYVTSATATPTVKVAADGTGSDWFAQTAAVSNAKSAIFTINTPVSHVQITGAAGDSYVIR